MEIEKSGVLSLYLAFQHILFTLIKLITKKPKTMHYSTEKNIFLKNTLNVWAECILIQFEMLIILKSQTHKLLNYLLESLQIGMQLH